ncbi:MAG: hypothetical protein Q9227_001727 [Pyrenula ochraceoflavens]
MADNPHKGSSPHDIETEIYQKGLHYERPVLSFQSDQWEAEACKRLSADSKANDLLGYVYGSAGQRETSDKNREAFKRWSIVPRRLVKTNSFPSLETTVFGERLSCPIAMAPIGVQRIFNPDGELAAAGAAAKAGIPYILSTASSTSIEDVAKANSSGQRWYQLYWPANHNNDITVSLLKRAKASGYSTLFVTLDTYILGWRPSDMDNGYNPFLRADQIGVELGFSDPIYRKSFREKHGKEIEDDQAAAAADWTRTVFPGTSHGWEDLKFLQKQWDGPIVLKGIQSLEDARKAVEVGVQGIVVSNHGGRQQDGGNSSLAILPHIVDAVGGKLTIFYDSGVRCGADIVKALALGAECVLVGRPYVYGLALGGEKGVSHVLRSLKGELELTLHLSGIPSIGKDVLNRSVLVKEDDLFQNIKVTVHSINLLPQRFDQGPSLLLLPHLFAEAFNDLGTSLEAENVKLVKCEPNYNIWFGDGESFELSTDVARMKTEIERWEGKDGFERYFQFLQESHRHYELSVTHVLRRNFTSLLHMARPSFLRHLLALHPFESIYSRASKYFWTERLRRVFTFGSMYMGMSPFDAPGTYSLLQYTELAEGIWYPIGGFYRVMDALLDCGKRLGAEYRFSTPVKEILISSDGRRANGVELASGERLNADVVLVNADLVYAYNELLPTSSYASSLSRRHGSCSSISFYWAMDRTIPELKAHNIFLADEYRNSFDDIFKKQMIPEEPSFYVNVPSRVDATAAPPGTDSIVVLVPVGHLLDGQEGRGLDPQTKQDWEAMEDKARRAVFSTIKSRTGADLQKHVVHEIINTPGTWKTKFNLDKGAILGLSHSFFNVLSFRPSTQHSKYRNLYFVGASTHPGTGVPICLAGSKITSEQILNDLKMAKPWDSSQDTAKQNLGREIDQVQMAPMLSNFHIAVLVAVIAVIVSIYYSSEAR